MKKALLSIVLLSILALPSYAGISSLQTGSYFSSENEDSYTMDTIWQKNGKFEEKVITIGAKLLNDNEINKRIPFMVERTKTINASSFTFTKTVVVYKGIFPYIDNDDELAFIIAHEISHSLDAYGGLPAWIAYTFNSKHYEYKSDLMAIDMMVKSGYNPVAAITCANKFFPESHWDIGLFTSHPKTSKRLLAVYKYVSVKYPWALNTQMASNIHFVNFKRAMDRDIKQFEQKKLEKELKRQQKSNANQKL